MSSDNRINIKRVKEVEWNIFSKVHREKYGENHRHTHTKDNEVRTFLTSSTEREDGLSNLVAMRILNQETGESRHSIREDVRELFLELYQSI